MNRDCEAVKSHPAGSQHCNEARRKNRRRKSISADRKLVIYIFMNVPLIFCSRGENNGEGR